MEMLSQSEAKYDYWDDLLLRHILRTAVIVKNIPKGTMSDFIILTIHQSKIVHDLRTYIKSRDVYDSKKLPNEDELLGLASFRTLLDKYKAFTRLLTADTSYSKLYRHFLQQVITSIESEFYSYNIYIDETDQWTGWYNVHSPKGRIKGVEEVLRIYIADGHTKGVGINRPYLVVDKQMNRFNAVYTLRSLANPSLRTCKNPYCDRMKLLPEGADRKCLCNYVISVKTINKRS